MTRSAHLSAIAVFLLICSGLFVAAGLLALTNTHATASRASLVVTAAAGVLGLATGTGILRRWRWARLSIIAFAAFIATIGCAFAPFLLFLRGAIPPEATETGRVLLSSFCLLLVAIGLWWAYLFSDAKTKELFRVAVPVNPIPFSIAVMAWYLVISAALTASFLWTRNPAPTNIFGFVLRSWGAVTSRAVFTVVNLSVGLGLLRRGKHSVRFAAYYWGFQLLDIAISLLRPGWDSRASRSYDLQLARSPSLGAHFSAGSWLHFTALGTAVSAVIALLALLALSAHKNVFASPLGSTAITPD